MRSCVHVALLLERLASILLLLTVDHDLYLGIFLGLSKKRGTASNAQIDGNVNASAADIAIGINGGAAAAGGAVTPTKNPKSPTNRRASWRDWSYVVISRPFISETVLVYLY